MSDSRNDESILSKSVTCGLAGIEQIEKILRDGTSDIKNLLFTECDVILECRVCRNMFRSIINFVTHKRSYCKELHNSGRRKADNAHHDEREQVRKSKRKGHSTVVKKSGGRNGTSTADGKDNQTTLPQSSAAHVELAGIGNGANQAVSQQLNRAPDSPPFAVSYSQSVGGRNNPVHKRRITRHSSYHRSNLLAKIQRYLYNNNPSDGNNQAVVKDPATLLAERNRVRTAKQNTTSSSSARLPMVNHHSSPLKKLCSPAQTVFSPRRNRAVIQSVFTGSAGDWQPTDETGGDSGAVLAAVKELFPRDGIAVGVEASRCQGQAAMSSLGSGMSTADVTDAELDSRIRHHIATGDEWVLPVGSTELSSGNRVRLVESQQQAQEEPAVMVIPEAPPLDERRPRNSTQPNLHRMSLRRKPPPSKHYRMAAAEESTAHRPSPTSNADKARPILDKYRRLSAQKRSTHGTDRAKGQSDHGASNDIPVFSGEEQQICDRLVDTFGPMIEMRNLECTLCGKSQLEAVPPPVATKYRQKQSRKSGLANSHEAVGYRRTSRITTSYAERFAVGMRGLSFHMNFVHSSAIPPGSLIPCILCFKSGFNGPRAVQKHLVKTHRADYNHFIFNMSLAERERQQQEMLSPHIHDNNADRDDEDALMSHDEPQQNDVVPQALELPSAARPQEKQARETSVENVHKSPIKLVPWMSKLDADQKASQDEGNSVETPTTNTEVDVNSNSQHPSPASDKGKGRVDESILVGYRRRCHYLLTARAGDGDSGCTVDEDLNMSPCPGCGKYFDNPCQAEQKQHLCRGSPFNLENTSSTTGEASCQSQSQSSGVPTSSSTTSPEQGSQLGRRAPNSKRTGMETPSSTALSNDVKIKQESECIVEVDDDDSRQNNGISGNNSRSSMRSHKTDQTTTSSGGKSSNAGISNKSNNALFDFDIDARMSPSSNTGTNATNDNEPAFEEAMGDENTIDVDSDSSVQGASNKIINNDNAVVLPIADESFELFTVTDDERSCSGFSDVQSWHDESGHQSRGGGSSSVIVESVHGGEITDDEEDGSNSRDNDDSSNQYSSKDSQSHVETLKETALKMNLLRSESSMSSRSSLPDCDDDDEEDIVCQIVDEEHSNEAVTAAAVPASSGSTKKNQRKVFQSESLKAAAMKDDPIRPNESARERKNRRRRERRAIERLQRNRQQQAERIEKLQLALSAPKSPNDPPGPLSTATFTIADVPRNNCAEFIKTTTPATYLETDDTIGETSAISVTTDNRMDQSVAPVVVSTETVAKEVSSAPSTQPSMQTHVSRHAKTHQAATPPAYPLVTTLKPGTKINLSSMPSILKRKKPGASPSPVVAELSVSLKPRPAVSRRDNNIMMVRCVQSSTNQSVPNGTASVSTPVLLLRPVPGTTVVHSRPNCSLPRVPGTHLSIPACANASSTSGRPTIQLFASKPGIMSTTAVTMVRPMKAGSLITTSAAGDPKQVPFPEQIHTNDRASPQSQGSDNECQSVTPRRHARKSPPAKIFKPNAVSPFAVTFQSKPGVQGPTTTGDEPKTMTSSPGHTVKPASTQDTADKCPTEAVPNTKEVINTNNKINNNECTLITRSTGTEHHHHPLGSVVEKFIHLRSGELVPSKNMWRTPNVVASVGQPNYNLLPYQARIKHDRRYNYKTNQAGGTDADSPVEIEPSQSGGAQVLLPGSKLVFAPHQSGTAIITSQNRLVMKCGDPRLSSISQSLKSKSPPAVIITAGNTTAGEDAIIANRPASTGSSMI